MSSDLKSANLIIDRFRKIISANEFILNDESRKLLNGLEATARDGFQIGSGALPNVKISIGKILRELRAKNKSQRAAIDEIKSLV